MTGVRWKWSGLPWGLVMEYRDGVDRDGNPNARKVAECFDEKDGRLLASAPALLAALTASLEYVEAASENDAVPLEYRKRAESALLACRSALTLARGGAS